MIQARLYAVCHVLQLLSLCCNPYNAWVANMAFVFTGKTLKLTGGVMI